MATVFAVGPPDAQFIIDVTGDVVTMSLDAVNILGEQQAAEADTAAATATSIAATIGTAAPAGGTGATAGAYDTAGNRDAAITLLNELRTHAIEVDLDYEALLVDVAALRVTVNSLLAKLRTHGIIAT